ncbi:MULTISPECIES: Na+/H+ antiporter [Paenibacillus]|uniref:Sodium, potassium, lithium and rubidium/H(+) antiporter n=1 Tax=Paenibacillus albilobatus TaxID=2716884 RepID=A0A919XBN1_9BACL|nr:MULTISPECIES: Na+/H+ antiporter [Paenibacillus]GIO29176.1 sodium, potassium, lithium and rubidium/H(+) antiporter [Paenibacillus albilobatus]
MEIFLMVLVLLLLIGISNVINHFLPVVPVPIIQIGLGVVATFVPGLHHIPLNPELFLLLFIAPLLFNDGKITPRDELWQLRSSILLLALGLVFATVLIAGPFIHWIIPAIPLSAAFALAAILSPTDAVAVGSLSGRAKLPGNIMRLLEGEALMNDASGLVAFNFAIAATVTGQFSLPKAIGSFIVIAIGGVIAGVVLGFLIIGIRMQLRRMGMEDVTLHMLIIILTPFIIYWIAEEVHVSGILAVVAAGVTHAIERDRMRSGSVRLRLVSDSTWSVILFCLNGLVFILLGLEIPGVIIEVWKDPAYNNGQVIGYIFLITAVLIILRFLWVWAVNRHFRSALLTALSGVRGALTLSAAFSIPLTLADFSPFPERSLILFICSGVILLTLIIASVLLPILTREAQPDPDKLAESERAARIRVLEAGLKAVREEINDENRQEAIELTTIYSQRLQMAKIRNKEDLGKAWKQALDIRIEALRAEKRTADRWMQEGRISPKLADRFRASLSRVEALLTTRKKIKKLLVLGWAGLLRILRKARSKAEVFDAANPKWRVYKELKLDAIRAAIKQVKSMETSENHDTIQGILADYRSMELQLLSGKFRGETVKELSAERRELELKAIQAERNEIQTMFEKGEISRTVANTLRMDVNYHEGHLYEAESVHEEEAEA